MKNNNLEIFKLILGDDNNVKLVFSDEFKELVSLEKIEAALREDVQEHLTPIMETIVSLIAESNYCK